MQGLLPGFHLEGRRLVETLSLDASVDRAVSLLREYEPEKGYYLTFSGGKDSCVVKKLAQISGVKFDAFYSNTTIDPPELIHFIKREHPDVRWAESGRGNMFVRIATRIGPPPTRSMRWCCDEYKEMSGDGRVKLFGVRAAESAKRAHRWREVAIDIKGYESICPIVWWSDAKLFEFISSYEVKICDLYKEGWRRLGCVGCFLNPESRSKEFNRWPKYAERWEWAVKENWRNHQGKMRRDGKPYMHARFNSAEDFWVWWLNDRSSDIFRDECQSGILWTNEESEGSA